MKNKLEVTNNIWRIMVFVSIVVSMLFIFVYYGIAYSELGIQKIPVGWDTPNYVSGINSVREDGLLETIKEYNFVNFFYYTIAASIPVSSILVETYFPILLAMLAVLSVTLFVRNLFPKEYPMVAASAIFMASSFLLYRVTADLHSNLLGFIFIISAFAILFAKKPINHIEQTLFQRIRRFVNSRGVVFIALVILSSFTHFESAIFFSIVFYIAYTLSFGFHRSKPLFVLLILCLMPSMLLFARHFLDQERFPAELRIFHDPLPYEFLLRPIGVYLPLIVAASALLLFLFWGKSKFFRFEEKKGLYFFISFTLVWLALSLIIFRTGYFNEGFYPFSYRAATLLPIPLIASIPFYFVNHLSYQKHYFPILTNIFAYALIFSFGTLNLLFLVENQLSDDNTTFLSDSAYKALQELEKLKIEQTPIFVYYFHDPSLSPGGLSEYPDRWINAIYGDHYKYLGFVDNLAGANETIFSDIYSRYYSYAYKRDMISDGMWNVQNISKSPVLVIPDFYNLEYFRDNPKFTPISEHVYLFNSDPDITGTIYKMSSLRLTNPSNWNVVQRDVNDSREEVLELYGPSGDNSAMKLSFPTDRNDCYEFETRYIDGTKGLGFTLTINDDSQHTFYYENENSIHDIRLPYCTNSTLTNITITPSARPGIPVAYEFIAFENALYVHKMTN